MSAFNDGAPLSFAVGRATAAVPPTGRDASGALSDVALGCDSLGNFDIHAIDAALWVTGQRPVAATVWESSRVFVAETVPAANRLRVQMQLIHEMVISARTLGAATLLGIIPEHSWRLARRVGLDCVASGPAFGAEGQRSIAVTISMQTKLH